MTAEGFPETDEEIRAAIRTPEFKELAGRLEWAVRHCNPSGEGARESVIVFLQTQIRARYGPLLAEGLVEWLKDGVE